MCQVSGAPQSAPPPASGNGYHAQFTGEEPEIPGERKGPRSSSQRVRIYSHVCLT